MVHTIKPGTLRSKLSWLRTKKKKLIKGSSSYIAFMSVVFELCRGRTVTDINIPPSAALFSTGTPPATSLSTGAPSAASLSTETPPATSLSTGAPSAASLSTETPPATSLSTGAPSAASLSTGTPSAASLSTGTPPAASLSTGAPSAASLSTGTPPAASLSTGAPSAASLSTGAPSAASLSTGAPPAASLSTGAPPAASLSTGAPHAASLPSQTRNRTSCKREYPPPPIALCSASTCNSRKQHHLLQYECTKNEKRLRILKKKIATSAVRLSGHYSKKNVDKRQKRAMANQREVQKLKKDVQQHFDDADSMKIEMLTLKAENSELKRKHAAMTGRVRTYQLRTKNAQKVQSKLKMKLLAHADCIPNTKVRLLKKEISGKNQEIHRLESELDMLKKDSPRVLDLKDGSSYSIGLRMLVNELTALQVAQSKISSVIEAVSHHLFDTKIEKLPDRKSVQNINDEGHYVVKRYISSELDGTSQWSLHKDGTTRKKQKILDTTAVVASGATFSLGFCTVASETGNAISTTAQNHLKELAAVSGKDEGTYIASALMKLTAYMSDRASNEKKSNKLLDAWRNSVLEESKIPEAERNVVHHCYCMAHVLLGFHKNVISEVQKLQKDLEEHESLGRDALNRFAQWRQQSIPERVAYNASSVFGPVGDYRGARDVWESHCSLHGIKSKISNYKDNRFNGLFETCAQVYHHKKDFLYVLSSRNSNALLQSIKADLEDPKVVVFIQAMGILFLQVTGPYWNLMESQEVPYLNLGTVIQPLVESLESYVEDPTELFLDGPPCLQAFKDESTQFFHEIRNICHPEYSELLEDLLKVACTGMVNTIKKQLVDFLPGGLYGNPASEDVIASTAFIPKTNLSCEHHFGDLDSSQRRRPNCTMHHHSTVQMMKRNRVPMKMWYSKMSAEEKKTLWSCAKKNASKLREKHKKHEEAENSHYTLLQCSNIREKGSHIKKDALEVQTPLWWKRTPCLLLKQNSTVFYPNHLI